jgi:hypothetical protein
LVAVHEKVVPATLDVRFTSVVDCPEQIVCVKGVLVMLGNGLTVIGLTIVSNPQLFLQINVI